jgi:hypothetical protein
MRIGAAAILALMWALPAPAAAQDWPDFRGPGGQGHSPARGVPVEWGESRNVTWKSAVPGSGWSTPIVAGDRVWVTTAVENRGVSLRALAFDAATGRELVNVEVFRTRAGSALHPKNTRASPPPSSKAIASTSISARQAPRP